MTELLELVVDFTGCGLHCQRCGDSYRVRMYRILGQAALLDWMCAAIVAAAALEALSRETSAARGLGHPDDEAPLVGQAHSELERPAQGDDVVAVCRRGLA